MKYTTGFKTEVVIGLEVHIELKTASKMFCSCKAEHFGAVPNTQTCPVCLGLPGALPYPNQKAIEWTALLGIALNCQISEFSKFDRKNYFYPDLPKGYQISQYDLPLAVNGKLECKVQTFVPTSSRGSSARGSSGRGSAKCKVIRIRRVHLEEDTGKLIHEKDFTLIDFNRSGVPLVEIVTEPDFTSVKEARFFLQGLQQLVRYLDVSEADMEKGQMRCEPNVNLKITENGKTYFTPISEIKNVNSFRFVEKAIDSEIERQLAEFQKTRREKAPGNKETRGWDEAKGVTFLQREKEEASDYRYFPEPDIPPLRWSQNQIKALKEKIPELPSEKEKRFVKIYGLRENVAQILTETLVRADYYEEVVKMAQGQGLEPKEIANLMVNKRLDSEKLKPTEFVKVVKERKKVSTMPAETIKKVIAEVIKRNQKAVQDFKKGKTQAIEFLVGQVSRETQGKADSNLVRKLLLEALDAS